MTMNNDHIHPIMAEALKQAQEQALAMAADIRINQMKNDGTLAHMNDQRALALQLQHKDAQ